MHNTAAGTLGHTTDAFAAVKFHASRQANYSRPDNAYFGITASLMTKPQTHAVNVKIAYVV